MNNNHRNQRNNPEIQEQMDYNAKISSRSFVQNNQKINLNTRDTNLMQMPNNNSFLNDRTFTEYNTKNLQTQIPNQKQYENDNYNTFGPYSHFNTDNNVNTTQYHNSNNNVNFTHNSYNKQFKNVDLEYDLRIPIKSKIILPPKGDTFMFNNKKRREYENQQQLSLLQNTYDKPQKNIDLGYDIRMPVTLCKTIPGKLDGPSPGMFDKKGWRDYNNQKYLSSLQN